MEETDKADRMYKKAIRMAPGIADTHLQYGLFLQDSYESPEFAIKEYKKAIQLPTKDAQVLRVLKRRVSRTGDKKLKQSLKERLQTT